MCELFAISSRLPATVSVSLALDAGFERAVVNETPEECHGRYAEEAVIIVPRPAD